MIFCYIALPLLVVRYFISGSNLELTALNGMIYHILRRA